MGLAHTKYWINTVLNFKQPSYKVLVFFSCGHITLSVQMLKKAWFLEEGMTCVRRAENILTYSNPQQQKVAIATHMKSEAHLSFFNSGPQD